MGTARRARFIQRRIMLGFSQEHLAAVLGIERSTVARWEQGVTNPRPWQRPELANQLQVTPDELDALLADVTPLAPGSEGSIGHGASAPSRAAHADPDLVLSVPWNHQGTAQAAAELSRGDEVERRTFLALSGAALTAPAHQWLIHEPESLTSALRGGSRISSELADRLPPMIAELRRMDDIGGGGTMLSLAQHEFSWVAGLLNQATYDEATGRKLHIALAELGQLIGWAADDDGQYALAQRYYLVGLRAAHSAGDRILGAHILGCMACQSARQGNPVEGVTLAETALAGAGHGAPASLLGVLYGRLAEALAGCQEAKACMTAIDKTQSEVERVQPADEPAWLYWVDRGLFCYCSGSSLVDVGRIDRAVPLLTEGLQLNVRNGGYQRDQQIWLIRLAKALAAPGEQQDLEAAAHHGTQAIHIAANLTCRGSTKRIQELAQQMQPYSSLPAVREFVEQAGGVGA